MNAYRNWIWLAFSLLLLAGTSRGQEITGGLRGTVQDESGSIVAGTKVVATQTETGLRRVSETDPQGAYVLLELPAGHYRSPAESCS